MRGTLNQARPHHGTWLGTYVAPNPSGNQFHPGSTSPGTAHGPGDTTDIRLVMSHKTAPCATCRTRTTGLSIGRSKVRKSRHDRRIHERPPHHRAKPVDIKLISVRKALSGRLIQPPQVMAIIPHVGSGDPGRICPLSLLAAGTSFNTAHWLPGHCCAWRYGTPSSKDGYLHPSGSLTECVEASAGEDARCRQVVASSGNSHAIRRWMGALRDSLQCTFSSVSDTEAELTSSHSTQMIGAITKDGVPLLQDLTWCGTEPLDAQRDPSVPLIDQVVAEHPQRHQ